MSVNKVQSNGSLSVIASRGQFIQYSVMPTPSVDIVNKIVQYIGTTTASYTNGYFYKCVLDGSVYVWENVQVQSASGGSAVDSVNGKTGTVVLDAKDIGFQVDTMPTAESAIVNQVVQYTGTTDSNYTNGYFYKCVENSGVYGWINIDIQEATNAFKANLSIESSATTSTYPYAYIKISGIPTNITSATKTITLLFATRSSRYILNINPWYDSSSKRTCQAIYISHSDSTNGTTAKINDIKYEWSSTSEIGTMSVFLKMYLRGNATHITVTDLSNNEDINYNVEFIGNDNASYESTTIADYFASIIAGELSNVSYVDDFKNLKDVNLSQLADNQTIKYDATTQKWVNVDPQDASGKADKVSNATNGDLAGLDSNGNLTDSGILATNVIQKSATSGLVKNDGTIDESDYLTASDVADKADKVDNATNGDLAGLDTNGNLTDSGILASNVLVKSNTAGLVKNNGTIDTNSYATTTQLANKTDKVANATANDFAILDDGGNLVDSGVNKNIVPSNASSSNKLATQSDIASAYRPSGNATLATLPALTEANLNRVYNMTEDFVTTADFAEGAGVAVKAGNEVGIIDVSSTSTPDIKYTVLGGFIDLSDYIQKSQTSGLVKNDGTIDTSTYATTTQLANKADKVANASNGHLAGLDANGNLTDSGVSATSISDKADKVVSATDGDLAKLDSYGNLVDSGILADNVIVKSSTVGLVKNDGSIDTNSYATTSNAYLTGDTAETALADADYVPFYDTSATAKRKSTWSNIKSVLKAYFDTIYSTVKTLSGLTDTNITSPSQGQILEYDAASSKWVNAENIQDFARYGGSKLFSELTSSLLVADNVDKFYLCTDGGTISSADAGNWILPAGAVIPPDAHIAVIEFSTGVYKFDDFGGYVDISGKADKTELTPLYSTSDATEATLADNDKFPFYDTSASGKRSSTWSNIKSVLKTYFDGIYSTVSTRGTPTSGGTTLSLVNTGDMYTWNNKAGTAVVSKTANGLAPQLPNETTTTKFLRQDGSWQVPSYPSAYTSNPNMDGTASAGSSTNWARGDHRHPTDTTRAANTSSFTQATTRANIASGETISVILGKISKWFADLEDLAFIAKDGTSSTKYLRGDGTWQSFPAINNGTLTIQKNGSNVTTFTANQSSNATANIVTDIWSSQAQVSSGSISFTGIDDTNNNGYELFINVTSSSTEKNPTSQIATISGTGTSSMSITFSTNADEGAYGKLRIIR